MLVCSPFLYPQHFFALFRTDFIMHLSHLSQWFVSIEPTVGYMGPQRSEVHLEDPRIGGSPSTRTIPPSGPPCTVPHPTGKVWLLLCLLNCYRPGFLASLINRN